MRRKLLWLAASLLVAAPSLGAAQSAPAFGTPHLRRFVAQVLERNAGLSAREAAARAAAERVAPAGALPDPTLSFGLMSAPTPSFDLDREAMTQFPVALQQRIPFPGKQAASAEVGRGEAAVAGARADLEAHRLAAEAARAFFELAYTRSAHAVWERRLELAEQAVRLSLTRYETGRAPQAEVLRAQVRKASLTEHGHRLAADVRVALARADALRGAPEDSLPTPALLGPDSAALLAVLRDTFPGLDALRARLAGNPALAVADGDVERARASARVFAIAARPDLVLTAQYAPRLDREDFLSGMIGLSIPLWASRKQGPAAEAGRLEWAATRDHRDDLRARLDGELRERAARLDALRAQVDALRRHVLPLAEAASESALRSYSVGAVDLTSVLDAQDDLFQSQLDLARRIADYGAQRAALSALLGEEWYR